MGVLSTVSENKPRRLFFAAHDVGSTVGDVQRAGNLQRYLRQTRLREEFRKIRPSAREAGPDELSTLKAKVRFILDKTATANTSEDIEDVLKVALEHQNIVEKAGRLLGPAGVAFGAIALAQQHFGSTGEKVDAGVTAVGIGGGVVETAMLVGVAVPGGEVIVAVIGLGVGAYELGKLAADFVRTHEAEFRDGLADAASTFEELGERAEHGGEGLIKDAVQTLVAGGREGLNLLREGISIFTH